MTVQFCFITHFILQGNWQDIYELNATKVAELKI